MFIRDEHDWRYRARCRSTDPELFFPIGRPDSTARQAQTARAKLVCAGCPVLADCLAWVLAGPATEGVVAGTTEKERVRLLRGRPETAPVAA